MIVQCPECQTKYNLPDSKILDSGTKVRCSRCTHTFIAYPEGVEPLPEPASTPQPEAKAAPAPKAPQAAPAASLSQSPKEDGGADAPLGGKPGKAASEAGFDEDDFLAGLNDLGDLGKDPFGDKQKDSDEISFSDDFLKEDLPAKADRKKKSVDEDEDVFGGLSSEADLDALLGDKPVPRKQTADDLGLDDLDFGGDFAASSSRGNKASKAETDDRDDLGLDADLGMGEPAGRAGEGRQDKPGASAQEELGDDEFEAALRGLSMDLDEGAPAPAARSAGRQQFMEQSLDQSQDEDLWPTADSERDFSAERGSDSREVGLGLSLDEEGPESLGDFDRKPRKERKKSGAGKLLLFLLLFVFLLAGGGIAAIHYLGLWSSLPPWVQDLARTAGLPQDGKMAKPAEEQVRLLSLENIRQYTVQNEKAGQVFVIEGKVVNNFPSPKELIRVQASLYDQTGNVVVSKDMSAGNTVSLFQLQIMSPQEIDAALNSDVGILSNNTDVQSGQSVPFMAVFFNAPETVAEFGVKVIEAKDPAK